MSNFEFECVYDVHGNLSGSYAPDVTNSDEHDVLIDWVPRLESTDWHAMTGITGQYGYSGAVMHPSENLSDEWILAYVKERGGSEFAIVEVQEEDGGYPEGDPIGWALVWR